MADGIDAKSWEVDCAAALEAALPPQWEYRDRAWGTQASWRPFPDSVSAEINALARRGQRRGNVNLSNTEFIVDFRDMVATPTDQYAVPRMLRKSVKHPKTSPKALKAFFERYADPLHPADHPAGPDGISGEKFLQLFKDLDVDPGTDVVALALASACNAAEMGVFRRREFICGCAVIEADTVEDLKAKMPEVRAKLLAGRTLPEVYAYTFGVALDPPCKVLPLEEATQYWQLLLPDWPLREAFCDWANQHMRLKTINRDVWMMILKLALEVPADLSTYDDDPAWPVVLDDFVEHYRAQKGS